jgi:sugar lactone lactonase YvrE
MTAIAQPVITTAPMNQTVVAGDNATFSVAVSGNGPFSYQWQCNGTNLPNGIITTIAGSGTATNSYAIIGGFSGDGGLATNAALSWVDYAIADFNGNLIIADSGNARIRKVATNGIITTIAGNGSHSFSGDGGVATNAALNAPVSVALDASGNLYISDSSNYRIRMVNSNGIITTVAGGRTPPNSGSYAALSGDGGQATNAMIFQPAGISIDDGHNLIMADSWIASRVRKVDTNGIISTVAGNGLSYFAGDGGFATNASLSPQWAVKDSTGNIYIADGSRVRKVDRNGIILTVAGKDGSVPPTFFGDGGAATNASFVASGIAVDTIGNIFIADGIDNRIRKVATNGVITTVAGSGTATNSYGYLIGGFSGDSGFATNASLNNPRGVSVDSNGNLFIADYYNARVRKVDYSGAQPTMKLNAVNTNNAGNYLVIVTDSLGNSVTSSVVQLTVSTPVYNQIVLQRISGGRIQFAFSGLPGTNYVLERTFTLAPANWIPQFTNLADVNGNLIFSNSPVSTTNNFWRIRSVP